MTTCVSTRANGYAISRDLSPTLTSVGLLKPLGRETRKHPQDQLRKLARSLDEFGFVLPVVTDEQQRVIAGWGLVLAARKLGLPEVPAVQLSGLSEAHCYVAICSVGSSGMHKIFGGLRRRLHWRQGTNPAVANLFCSPVSCAVY